MPLPSPPNTASSSSALGIPIACYRDATATREYLKLLENEPEEQFITRLMEQDKEGGSAVGMIIARHQDATTTQAYLQLLKNALETENISNFFKSSPLSLLPINKSRKIQITSEQLQELESLLPPNQQHNDVKESIVALINEFNKGSITKENLFEKLRNSIDEGNPEYLFVERAMTSSTPSPATQRRKM